MESLWESYNLLHRSFTAELQDTQRDLQELIGKAAGQGPAGARGGGGGGGRAQDVIAGLSLRTCSEEVLVTAMKQVGRRMHGEGRPGRREGCGVGEGGKSCLCLSIRQVGRP